MGKIYCSECGTELDDTAQFCSNCGTKIDSEDLTSESMENSDNSNSIEIKETQRKSKSSKHSNNKKIILGLAGICIILLISIFALTGFSDNTTTDSSSINDNSEQPYIDTIYGIDFSIPGYFKNVESKDYEDDGNGGISCTRAYERPDGTGIAIIVGTNPDGWDLNNAPAGIDMTVNGHHGKLSSTRDVFGYISGDKLVVISGTSQEEVEEIIIG